MQTDAPTVRRHDVRRRKVLPDVRRAISRCRADDHLAIASVLEMRALTQAAELDALAPDAVGPMHGVPFVVKNLIDVAEQRPYAGGSFDELIETGAIDARVVRQLTAAGAVLVGTTPMGEYDDGLAARKPYQEAAVNPRARWCISGGSSSGSAVSVAAGLVPFALGSDTNGAIRVQAALCGVYGFKPAFDALSRDGARAFVQSLDHVGVFAESLHLLETAYLAALPAGSTYVSPQGKGETSAMRIGFASGDFSYWCHAEVLHALRASLPALADDFAVPLGGVAEAFAAASVITAVEAAHVYPDDAVHYPHRYDGDMAARLRAGARVDPKAYASAKAIQTRLTEMYLALFDDIDVLVTPVLPITAPAVGNTCVALSNVSFSVADALGLFVRPFSLTGLPALTVPVPARELVGLALQLVCAPRCEALLWQAARDIEKQLNASTPEV
jgi:aspartyl-tRNA(Asn)/glutamyl-tRNA(Gln) amidotransferase subunit A